MALFRMAFFRLFALVFRHFARRISFFRLFAWRYFVFSLFRLAFFRYFVFSLGVISSWRRAITPGEKTKERNNELAQTSHHREQKWDMLFHPDKCNNMQVTRSRNPLTFKYSLRGQDLEAVNTAKYLGVDLSNNLSWNSHIDRTAKKANSMLGFLGRNLRITIAILRLLLTKH